LTKFKGYLDRLRENLETLDEQIENARAMSKRKGKDANALQWAKTLRDLIELRNETLEKIKVHLLGRDETGSPTEPADYFDGNPEVAYERYFKNMLSPWTLQDLKLKCEDCGKLSEEVSNHYFDEEEEYLDLCEKCYDKRTTESSGESKDADLAGVAEPASKDDARAILQGAALQIKVLRTFPIDQRIARLEELLADEVEVAPGMEPAYEAYRTILREELDRLRG
jgi:hypothetical protein